MSSKTAKYLFFDQQKGENLKKMYVKPIEKLLKISLMEKGLSYNSLSADSSVSIITISKIMRGGRITTKTAKRIADALGKPVTELFTVE